MTQTKQDKRARPAAVELRDDALDQAAGGAAGGAFGGGVFVGASDTNGDGSVRTITGGTTKPRT